MSVRFFEHVDRKRSHNIAGCIRRLAFSPALWLTLTLCGAIFVDSASSDEEDSLDFDKVVSELLSDDPHVQNSALSELEYRGNSILPILPTLFEVIRRANRENRIDALHILADFPRHAKAAVRPINELLRDNDVAVRMAAADALLKIDGRNDAAIAALADALRDDDEENRVAAARFIGDAGFLAESTVRPLTLAAGDRSPNVRAEVARALGEVGIRSPVDSLAALHRLLADDAAEVRLRAAKATWQFDQPAESFLPVLIEIVANTELNGDRDPTEELFENHALPARCALELIAAVGPEAKAALPALIAAIESARPVLRFSAVDALAAIGPEAESAIEPLAKALRDTEVHSLPFAHRTYCLSDSAAIALRRIGPASVDTLLEALSDQHERVIANAADALGYLPDAHEKTVPALIKLLDHHDKSVRASAAYALGRIGPAATAAAPELARRLNDEGEWTSYPGGGIGTLHSVRGHALAALTMISPAPASIVPRMADELKKSRHISDSMCEMLRRLGPSANSAAAETKRLLDDADEETLAALALARIAPQQEGLVDHLRSGLRNTNDYSGVNAARGLGDLGETAVVGLPELYLLLDRLGEPSARAVIAAAIIRIDRRQPKAIVELAIGLQESGESFRSPGHDDAAATWRALGKDAGPALEQLMSRLRIEGTEPRFGDPFAANEQSEGRLRSAELLVDVSVATPVVIDTLIELCESDDSRQRGRAADALGRIGRAALKAMPALVRLLPDQEFYTVGGDFYGNGGTHFEPGERAAQALVMFHATAVDSLRIALKEDHSLARQRAAEALGAIGEPANAAVGDLTIAIIDRRYSVRAVAAEALGKIHATKPSTVAALAHATADPHLPVRVAAAKALGELGPAAKDTVAALNTLRDDPCVAARNAAEIALQKIRGK